MTKIYILFLCLIQARFLNKFLFDLKSLNYITDFIWNIQDPLKATLGDFNDSRNLFRRFHKLSEFKASDNIEILSMNSSSFQHIPAWINGTPTPINFNVDIYYIFDVDTFKSSYGASLMTEIFWFDDRYSWNASEFSGPSNDSSNILNSCSQRIALFNEYH